MKDTSSKNKILIVVAATLFVAAVILVVVILKTNEAKNSDDKDGSLSDLGLMTQSDGIDTEIKTDSSKIETVNGISDSKNTEIDDTENNSTNSENKKEEKTKTPIEVTLGDYKGLTVSYSPTIITDEMVQESLNELQDDYTEIITMPDRLFEEGDMAIVTFEGKVNGETIDELYGVCLQDIIGSELLPKQIEDEIVGKRIGDKFTVDIDYPDDFSRLPEVAGKTVKFDINLEDGFAFDIPEINDAFIKKVSKYSTLAEYKDGYKADRQAEENQKAYDAAIEELKRKIVDNCIFSDGINDEIKMAYVVRINEENEDILQDYWMDAATYYEIYYGMSAEEYQKKIMDEVGYNVKYEFALAEIAKQENVSEEEAEQIIIDSAIIDGLER